MRGQGQQVAAALRPMWKVRAWWRRCWQLRLLPNRAPQWSGGLVPTTQQSSVTQWHGTPVKHATVEATGRVWLLTMASSGSNSGFTPPYCANCPAPAPPAPPATPVRMEDDIKASDGGTPSGMGA